MSMSQVKASFIASSSTPVIGGLVFRLLQVAVEPELLLLQRRREGGLEHDSDFCKTFAADQMLVTVNVPRLASVYQSFPRSSNSMEHCHQCHILNY